MVLVVDSHALLDSASNLLTGLVVQKGLDKVQPLPFQWLHRQYHLQTAQVDYLGQVFLSWGNYLNLPSYWVIAFNLYCVCVISLGSTTSTLHL